MIIYYAGTGEGANFYIPNERLRREGVNILMTFYYTFVNGKNEKRFMKLFAARKRKLKLKRSKK